MYELGIADALLGANRTIILADENTKIEKLAFDINHKRICFQIASFMLGEPASS